MDISTIYAYLLLHDLAGIYLSRARISLERASYVYLTGVYPRGVHLKGGRIS